MARFSDYINNSSNEKKQKDNIKNYSNEDLQKMIDKYSSYSEDNLMNEFIKLTIEKKRKGELKDDELNSIKQTILPMLNESQKEQLNKILEMVKNVK